ncbi:S8 family serine peptidase [Phycicoccus sp.]|uniref:S8 family serine peptidase n=1 Tax=Phycicoccus sp. TaxID=1902410 RepID=UPI002C073899|nr:S8 family serine peptidase [Phycicoccus sp.]HMM93528.1 S8 family serine peptidase [Phycicoccus sp.]
MFRTRRTLFALLGSVTLVGALAGTASASPADPGRFTATALTPTSTTSGDKSPSGSLAQSDPALLKRTDSTVVPVMVKLDYDAAASYRGGVPGLAATSPEVTGRPLRSSDPNVSKYLAHAARESSAAAAQIRARLPKAKVTGTYTTVYGGLSVSLPANQAKTLLSLPGVAAVQSDTLNHPTAAGSYVSATGATIPGDTAKFVGATKVWPSLGGQKLAGKGVVLGVLDTGIWPEHPMLADGGYLPKPGPAGKTWGCQFGDGSDPALGAPFSCNNKLIGAYAFTDTNLAVNGTVPGEFCDTALTSAAHPYGTCSARDADGHGTHTSTTAAGNPVPSTPLLGVDRGPISGIAPGASVIMYRVCLTNGCYSSDSVRAVNQAIADGVNAMNFSIGGGANAYSDPVELAFLDAYAAGVSVSASAGNDGPGAATADHGGPWVTTVGASTADRAFQSTLTLTSSDGTTFSKAGATITGGVTDVPVVLAADVPGYTGGALCLQPFAAGSVAGKVVICERGTNGRVEKGYNASLGGAAGMVLYNPTTSDTETDNHFLPAIHLEGPNTEMLAFLAAHPGVTATWARGEVVAAQGDVMAGFSSRGPVGTDFLKPDITAPGVQVLAGASPQHIDIASGPNGELYQAIAGTSMASPHSAGISMLVKAAHPSWTPGQIKSALMTSSVQDVVNADGSAAGPFDRGAGSVRADRAVATPVTLDVSAADYYAGAGDPLDRVDLNVPSIDADPLPGALTTTRTVKNVSGRTQEFRASATADAGLAVTVSPREFSLRPNATRKITVTLDGTDLADGARAFAQVTLQAKGKGGGTSVLPVAVHRTPAKIALSQSCSGNPVVPREVSTCTVSVQNLANVATGARVDVSIPKHLDLGVVTAPAHRTRNGVTWSGTLTPALPPTVTSVDPGQGPAGGYLPLGAIGIPPTPGFDDETMSNFSVPAFSFGGETYTSVGVDSNGYVVVGGGTSADNECCTISSFPNPSRPNNVIAPFWTDLNPGAGGTVTVAVVTDGTTDWLVADWNKVVAYGSTVENSFEVWIQLGATEGQWMSYGDLGGANGQPLVTGVENRDGTSGINATAAANSELAVTMGRPTPGGEVTFRYQVSGKKVGSYPLVATANADVVKGSTTVKTVLTIAR